MKAKPPASGTRPRVSVPAVASKSASDVARAAKPALKTGVGHKAASDACHAPGTSPTTAVLPTLLSVEATALHLSVSTKTVRRLIERGALPCCRVGRLVRIRSADLAQLVASGTVV